MHIYTFTLLGKGVARCFKAKLFYYVGKSKRRHKFPVFLSFTPCGDRQTDFVQLNLLSCLSKEELQRKECFVTWKDAVTHFRLLPLGIMIK